MPNPNTGPFSPIAPLAPGGGGGGAWAAVGSRFTLGAPAATLLITGFDSTSLLWSVVFTKLRPVNNLATAKLDLRLGGSFPGDFLYEDHTQVSQSIQSTYSGTNGTGKEFIDIGGASAQGNDAGFPGHIQILIPDPGSTTERKIIQYSGITWTDTPRLRLIHGRGAHSTNLGALDAIELRYSAGNIAAGLTVDVYKLIPPA